MRLPRLPHLRKRRLQNTPKTGTPKTGDTRIKFYLGGLLLLLISFIVSFYLFFPTQALKERIEQEVEARTPVDLQIEQLSLLFPPGLEGREITVTSANPQLKKIEVSNLEVQPLWTTLFSRNPGLAVSAHLFGGTLGGTVRRGGAVAAQASRMAFTEPLLEKSSLQISGVLQKGAFSGAYPLRTNTQTHVDLALEKVRLTGLKPFGVSGDALELGNISLVGEGRGNSFRIDKLQAAGGSLEITGGGTFLIVTPFDRSRLNLNVVLQPNRNFDKALTDLLNLVAKPGRDGAYHLRVSGSLNRPVVR